MASRSPNSAPKTRLGNQELARAALEHVTQRLAIALRLLWSVWAIAAMGAGAINAQAVTSERAAGVCAVIAWTGALLVMYRCKGGLPRAGAMADVLGGAGLLLLGSVFLRPGMIGDGSTWVVLGGSLSALTAIWVLPGPLAAISSLLIGASYLAGIYLASNSHANVNQWQTLAYLAFAWAITAGMMRLLHRSAKHVDAAMRDLGVARQAFDAERDRLHHRATRDRILHDHVLTVLGLVSDNGLIGPPEQLRRQCHDGLARIRDLESGVGTAPKPQSFTRLSDVIAEIEDLGLRVTTIWRGDPTAIDAAGQPSVSALGVETLAEALRQSLLNVRRHAQATSTTVTVDFRSDELEIVVQDNGIGFTEAIIPATSRGIRDSIKGGMQEAGGAAEVHSTPGHGCTVRLSYPMTIPPPNSPENAKPDEPPGIMVRHAFERGMARAIGTIGIGWHLLSFSFLWTHADGYRSLHAVLAIWFAMLLAEILLLSRRDEPKFRQIIAVGTTLTITGGSIGVLLLCKAWSILGYENWGLGDAGFLLAYLVTYNRLKLMAVSASLVGFANLVVVAIVATSGSEIGSLTDSVTKIAGVFVASSAMQAGEIAVYRMLQANAETVERARAEVDRFAAMRLTAMKIAEDRAMVYAEADEIVKPILASLANGSADPDSPVVRRGCKVAEYAVRRSYAAGYNNAFGRELHAFVKSAENLGVIVDLQCQANRFTPAPTVQKEISKYLLQMLVHSRPGRATVSIIPDCDLADPNGDSPADSERKYGVSTLSLYLPVGQAHSEQLAHFLRTVRDKPLGELNIGYELGIFDETSMDREAFAWLALSGRL